MATFGSGRYSCDTEATANAYSSASDGGSEHCQCNGCRFVRVRDKAYPDGFVRLLQELGIDPRKDGEVYHVAKREPGQHLYGGWFHFVGQLDETGDFPPVSFGENFTAFLCRPGAPHLSSLDGFPLAFRRVRSGPSEPPRNKYKMDARS